MMQMIEKNVINTPVWSLVLINGKDGIFSIGGTSAPSVRRAKMETDDGLARAGNHGMKRDGVVASRPAADIEMEADLSANEWKWSKVQGAEGWWQILMRGIWVDGSKVIENQPIILDASIIEIGNSSKLTLDRLTHLSSSHLRLLRGHFTRQSRGADNYPLHMISSMHIRVSTHQRYTSNSRAGMWRCSKGKETRERSREEGDSHWDEWHPEVAIVLGLLLSPGWARGCLLGPRRRTWGLRQVWKEATG